SVISGLKVGAPRVRGFRLTFHNFRNLYPPETIPTHFVKHARGGAMTVATTDIRERLALRPDPDEFEAIRRLWIDHSKAEDARDLDGLMATLTDDCVYKVVWTGHTWER